MKHDITVKSHMLRPFLTQGIIACIASAQLTLKAG